MNGIHDMGGMQGLGEIGYKESAPGFNEPWEVRLFALVQAMQTGSLRQYIEHIPAPEYLPASLAAPDTAPAVGGGLLD